MDAGPILKQEMFELSEAMTKNDLLREAASRGVVMMNEILDNYHRFLGSALEQNEEEASFAPKVRNDLAKVDWNNWR